MHGFDETIHIHSSFGVAAYLSTNFCENKYTVLRELYINIENFLN